MLFRIPADKFSNIQSDSAILYKLRQNIRQQILCQKIKADEVKIEHWLKQQLNISLTDFCLVAAWNLKIVTRNTDTISLGFRTPSIDKIMQIITYGDGTFFGTKMFYNAVKNSY